MRRRRPKGYSWRQRACSSSPRARLARLDARDEVPVAEEGAEGGERLHAQQHEVGQLLDQLDDAIAAVAEAVLVVAAVETEALELGQPRNLCAPHSDE